MLQKPFYHCRVEVGKTTWTVVKSECGTDVAIHQRCTAEYALPAFWQSIYKEKLIYGIKSILSITTIVFETGQFDMHLMKNPSLANPKIRHWGYQKGTNFGFENTKAMVLNRDNYTCQCCKGKHKDSKLEVHHIVFRSQGGSDEESKVTPNIA